MLPGAACVHGITYLLSCDRLRCERLTTMHASSHWGPSGAFGATRAAQAPQGSLRHDRTAGAPQHGNRQESGATKTKRLITCLVDRFRRHLTVALRTNLTAKYKCLLPSCCNGSFRAHSEQLGMQGHSRRQPLTTNVPHPAFLPAKTGWAQKTSAQSNGTTG